MNFPNLSLGILSGEFLDISHENRVSQGPFQKETTVEGMCEMEHPRFGEITRRLYVDIIIDLIRQTAMFYFLVWCLKTFNHPQVTFRDPL